MNKLWSVSCLICLWGSLMGQELYAPEHITEVKIVFQQKDWHRVLDSMKEAGNDDRLVADAYIDGKSYKKVGVRYKGNSSYNYVSKIGSSKLPLNIKVDYIDKSQSLPGGYESLKLANGFRDPSFIREVLAYDVARNYMAAPAANFARVYVNDEYLGLYTSVESVDDRFLDQYFGEHDGVLVKCDPNWNAESPDYCPEGDKSSLMYLGEDTLCYQSLYEMKSDTGWNSLVTLTRILNKAPDKIENYLDVDQTLWMLAYNNFLANLDSYQGAFCHNYYIYRDSGGIFHPIVWDMNMAFGGFRLSGLGGLLSDKEMQELSMFIHFKHNNEKRPLITHLLRNDLYRKVYVAHIKTMLQEQIVDSLLYKRVDFWRNFIRKHVKADSNKLYSNESFEENLMATQNASEAQIVGVMQLMEARGNYLRNHPLLQREDPEVVSVNHEQQGEQLAIESIVKEAKTVWLYYRSNKDQSFKRMPLRQAPDRQESNPDELIWTTEVPYKKGAQYYLVAEGEYTASLSPRKASWEFYTVE